MKRYFTLAGLRTKIFNRVEAKFTDAQPDGSKIDWRLLSETNLTWLEKTLQNACQRPAESEDKLGLAVVFFFHLKATLEGGPECDYEHDMFPDKDESDF